jgi:hypothetical protein
MSRTGRAGAAAFLCAALVLPWVGGVAIAFHHGHSPHHQEPSAHDAEALDLIVHGHHHEPGAPAHHHHLVIAKPSPATIRPSGFIAGPALLPWTARTEPVTSGAVTVHPERSHASPPGTTVSLALRI